MNPIPIESASSLICPFNMQINCIAEKCMAWSRYYYTEAPEVPSPNHGDGKGWKSPEVKYDGRGVCLLIHRDTK